MKEGNVVMNNLRDYRIKKGLTQRELALKVGLSEQAYQRYEYGLRKPNVVTAINIAKVLGVGGDLTKLWEGSPTIT